MWALLLRELRAGLRRWPGTDVGDEYGRLIAKAGSPDHADPTSAARSLGDLVDPTRPGGVMPVVNSVSRAVGRDVGGWSVRRVWAVYVQLEFEAREREQRSGDVSVGAENGA